MTDETPLRASVCQEDGCYALIPSEYRVKHAEGHASARKSARAFRGRLTKIDLDLAEVKDDHRLISRKLEQFNETPAPSPLSVEPWPEDERPPADDFDEDDAQSDLDTPAPSTAEPSQPSAFINAVHAFGMQPAIDRDDYPSAGA